MVEDMNVFALVPVVLLLEVVAPISLPVLTVFTVGIYMMRKGCEL